MSHSATSGANVSPLHPKHCADAMHQVTTPVVRSVAVARETHLVRIAAPAIAASIDAGQFVMIRMADRNAPLIGRALAVYDVIDDDDGRPHWIDLVYLKKGAFTSVLADAPEGTPVTVWGPLGNGFRRRPCAELIIAVGGIGQTPMLLLARDALTGPQSSAWADRVTMIYGARTGDFLANVDDFRRAGIDVRLCTDDGSMGDNRRVPDVLIDLLEDRSSAGVDPASIHVVTCGPEIMMQKVAEACDARHVDCQVSMETPMACGIGICYSCVAKIRQPEGDWDYKRTCVEGPIFDAADVVW